MNVLIAGISGKLAQKVALSLVAGGHRVTGVDQRPWPDAPRGVEVFELDIRKRAAEDLFRKVKPEAVVHMATVTHLAVRATEDRFRINLWGTRAIFDHCHAYGAKRCLFVGRHTYYGAASDSPLYHDEDDPPMAVTTFPELADLVAADLYAGSALWRYPELETTVLRCCYTLGPSLHGTLAAFLRGRRVPMVLGFDPLFHFMHEDDMAAAIALALERAPRGVFNVAGPPPVPLSQLVRRAGRTAIALPEVLYRLALGRFGLPRLPPGAVTHMKYPVVIDASAFHAATGFAAKHDTDAAIEAFRAATAT